MPQMAPMNWLSLFMYFIIVFSLVNTLNYFTFVYNNKNIPMKVYKNTKTTWKWL